MISPEVKHITMKHLRYWFAVILFLATAATLTAQIDTIVRSLVDQAARQRPPQQQPRPQTHRPQSNVSRQPKKLFDGTWLATQSKTNPTDQQTINRTFTLIIKDGKATK